MGIRLIPGWASAVLGRVSLSDASRVGEIGWNYIPYAIRSDKGRAPVTSCSTQRLRAWVSISSSHDSILAGGFVARDLVRLSVWGADMVGGMVGWMDG